MKEEEKRDLPQREGEFQLLSNLGTEGEEPGDRQVRGNQVRHKQDNLGVLDMQKDSNPKLKDSRCGLICSKPISDRDNLVLVIPNMWR